jgi:hypothetical protein
MGPLNAAESKIVNLQAAASQLRDEFVAWQCRLRKEAMRQAGGRPTEGMCAKVLDSEGQPIAEAIKVLLGRSDAAAMAKLFEFQVRRTEDPLERYEKAVAALSADYYQNPRNFDGVLTGLFRENTALLERLLGSAQSVLVFSEFTLGYQVPCQVSRLAPHDPLFQLTYWHNAMFNPHLPPDIAVAAFVPKWSHASRQRRVLAEPEDHLGAGPG